MNKFISEMFILFPDFVKFVFKSLIKLFEVTNAKLMILLDLYIIVMDGRRWRNGRSMTGINSP